MPLKLEQESALEVLDWLLEPRAHRREGRTFVMAVAFIRTAARNPGKWISVFDHFSETRDGPRLMLATVEGLVSQDHTVRNAFRSRQYEFCLELSSPIPNWLPTFDDEPKKTDHPRVSRWERLGSGGLDVPDDI